MSGDHMLRHLRQRADLKRITASAYDAIAAGSAAVTFSRDNAFYVEAVLTGFADGIGSVEIIGRNIAGDSIGTILTFTGNQRRKDVTLQFLNLKFVNTSGLTNEGIAGNVQVNAISRTGQPREEFTTIRQNIPVRFSGLRADEQVAMTGGNIDISGKVFMSMDGDVDRRDKLVFRGVTYNIRAFRKIMSRESLRDHRVLLVSAEDEL